MTTADTTYNGYTNYETWAVHLWLTNDEASQRFWAGQAIERMHDARMHPNSTYSVSEDARINLADELREWAIDNTPDLGASMWADLLGAALSEVDWFDIADSLLADCDGYEARD
jgi:hypothetical protein